MAVKASPGFPQQSGILITEVWSGKILIKFYQATVLAAISNTDYEGEISKQGDVVHIRTRPDIAIKKYQKGQGLDIQHPEPNLVDLTIDRANYWNAVIDDIDKFQADINYADDWAKDAGEQMKIAIDREVLGEIYADADAKNQGGTAGKISGNINMGDFGSPLTLGNGSGDVDPIQFMTNVGQVLDEQDVPESDRWIVIPAWLANRLKNSDLKQAYMTGDDTSPIRNGMLGTLDRMTVYKSNLLSTVTDGGNQCTHIIGGHKSALSFASQLTKNETLRAESTFGDLMRGLQVYGFDVLKGEALVHAYAKAGS